MFSNSSAVAWKDESEIPFEHQGISTVPENLPQVSWFFNLEVYM
jgi:hypothetical protein